MDLTLSMSRADSEMACLQHRFSLPLGFAITKRIQDHEGAVLIRRAVNTSIQNRIRAIDEEVSSKANDEGENESDAWSY